MKKIGLVIGLLVFIGCGVDPVQNPNDINGYNECNPGDATIYYSSCKGIKEGFVCITCTAVQPNGPVQGKPLVAPGDVACYTKIGGPNGNDELCVNNCNECSN